MSPEYVIADSGKREEHTTGAVRDIRHGKGRFDLISVVANRRLAKVYEGGAVKYSPRNWEKGMPVSRFLDSAKRHINDYEMIRLYEREGISLEQLPPDVNPHEDHLAQAVWNLFGIMHMEEVKPEMDDLGKVEEKEEEEKEPGFAEESASNILARFLRKSIQ